MQIGAEDYLRCRAPKEDEPWLQSRGKVGRGDSRADQINR